MITLVLLACGSGDRDPEARDPGGGSETGPPGTGLAPTALRRLTPSAYRNTVRDLFPGVPMPEVVLPVDPLVHGFDNNGEAHTPSALLVQQVHDAAIAVTAAAMADPDSSFGCPADGGPDPLACGSDALARLGPRMFRRPLSPSELAEATDLFAEVLQVDGFEVGIQVALQLWLQSPEFLYFPEFGADGSATGVVPLDGYEVASRLSYFLWNSAPDDALLAAAPGLVDPDAIEVQALRMLADPRAADGVDNFDRLWLALDRVDEIALDPATYPTFDDDVRDAIGLETKLFARRQIQEGTLSSLLTDPTAELTAETAEIYGVPLPARGLATLPADQRSGLLTRAAFLSTRAHAVHPSPVQRGVFVLEVLLCKPPGAPPPGVDTAVPEPSATDPTTNRDRYEVHEEQAACAGCHVAIDGIGFGFENYDSLGVFRATDAGFPVDATGTFAIGDLAGSSFDGAIEASALLAGSRTVSDCVTEGFTRYALGRSLGEGDEAGMAELSQGFVDDGGRFSELVLAIVRSEAFRSARRDP